MQNLLDNYFLQNPLRIAERTRLIMSLATALWNADHNTPLDQDALHLFLCDETRGDLTEEQKCFVRKCKTQVDRMYLRMLSEKEHESEAMCRPALPARSRCVRFFRQGKACTPLLVVRPLWAALGGFRGTKEKAGESPDAFCAKAGHNIPQCGLFSGASGDAFSQGEQLK